LHLIFSVTGIKIYMMQQPTAEETMFASYHNE